MFDSLLDGLLNGRLSPEAAAASVQFSIEEIEFLVPQLDKRLMQQVQQPDTPHALVYARFNLALAERTRSPQLIAQTCFTLSQLLPRFPRFLEERLELTERALPLLEKLQGPASLMAQAYYYASALYVELIGFKNDDPLKQRAVTLAKRALACDSESHALSDILRCELHTVAGTFLNDSAELTEGMLHDSAAHLEEALKLARLDSDVRVVGRILGNLGYTFLKLGELTRSEAALERAIQSLNEASEFRSGADEQLTRANLQRAKELLRGFPAEFAHASGARAPSGGNIAKGEQMAKWLASQTSLPDDERDQTRRYIVEGCCTEMSNSNQQLDAELRGRAMLTLAITSNMGPSVGDAAFAVCFARAAERYFEHCGNRQRLAATRLNLGQALATTLNDLPEGAYLSAAATCFESAWHEYLALGLEKPALMCLQCLAGCYKVMGSRGNAEADKRGDELLQLVQTSRGH